MRQSAILPMPSTPMHADEQKSARPTTAPVVTQTLEDLRLAEHVERVLRASGYESLRAVAVSVNDRIVFLQGRVPSYFLKQIAQATALAIPGTLRIRNCLDVVPPKRHSQDDAQTEPINSFQLKADSSMNAGLLIAEPDAELRRIYGRLSSVLGFRVETAADGLECWTKLRSRPPDVLVIDAEIPWGGGDGVLACLREDFNGAGPPTVYVTGDDPPETLSARFDVPTRQCFQKPFELTALFDSVCNRFSSVTSRRASCGDSPALVCPVQISCF